MRMKTIWMCRDRKDDTQSGFGLRRIDAVAFVVENRGYNYHSGFRQCVEDGWAAKPVRIRVPSVVASCLIKGCEI